MADSRRWHGLELRAPAPAMEQIAATLSAYPVTGLEEDAQDPGRLTAFAATAWDLEQVAAEIRDCVTRAGGDPESVRLAAFTVEEEDWLRVWKQGWRPTPLGRRLMVLPAWWTEPADSERATVRIEPGSAFGTGTHVSTALAWELLEPCVPGARRLLDVGAGSGLLALGALALEAGLRAVLTEADRGAFSSLQGNLAGNGAQVRAMPLLAETLPFRDGIFDLAVANLTAREQRVVDGDLGRVLAPGARIVLSGLREEQAEEASARWRRRGCSLEAELRREDWAALRWRLPGAVQEPLALPAQPALPPGR